MRRFFGRYFLHIFLWLEIVKPYTDHNDNSWKNIHHNMISKGFESNTWQEHTDKEDTAEYEPHRTRSIFFFIFFSKLLEQIGITQVNTCPKTRPEEDGQYRHICKTCSYYRYKKCHECKKETKDKKIFPPCSIHANREKWSTNCSESRIEQNSSSFRILEIKSSSAIFHGCLRDNRRDRPEDRRYNDNLCIMSDNVFHIRNIRSHGFRESLFTCKKVWSPSIFHQWSESHVIVSCKKCCHWRNN